MGIVRGGKRGAFSAMKRRRWVHVVIGADRRCQGDVKAKRGEGREVFKKEDSMRIDWGGLMRWYNSGNVRKRSR